MPTSGGSLVATGKYKYAHLNLYYNYQCNNNSPFH